MPAPVRMGVMSRWSSRRIMSSAMTDDQNADGVLDERAERARALGALDRVGASGLADLLLEAQHDHADDPEQQPAHEHDERNAQA